jgi:cyclic pyranopterin phosphate synthase
MTQHPIDRLGRPLTDLRLSLTDRCNLRCPYCMPREVFGAGYRFLPRRDVLTFEEITRVAGAAAKLGVAKLRLTGGEPLLRRGVAELVAMLAAIPGINDLAMTTNGTMLSSDLAKALRQVGLKRLTISLDALDAPTVAVMSGSAIRPEQVLGGIDHALEAGFAPIKVNMVVQAGVNEHALIPMATHFRHQPVVLRFIEYMDVGGPRGWQRDQVITAAQIHQHLDACWPLEPFDATPSQGVAREYRYLDGGGTIGLIAAVSQPFCRSCSRLRLSAQGMVHGCLFAPAGLDLRHALRVDRVDDERLVALLCGLWQRRDDRYSELRQVRQGTDRPLMGQLGG